MLQSPPPWLASPWKRRRGEMSEQTEEKEGASGAKFTLPINESFYKDLIGLDLYVPCSTWDEQEVLG